jgi:hypothetical protein
MRQLVFAECPVKTLGDGLHEIAECSVRTGDDHNFGLHTGLQRHIAEKSLHGGWKPDTRQIISLGRKLIAETIGRNRHDFAIDRYRIPLAESCETHLRCQPCTHDVDILRTDLGFDNEPAIRWNDIHNRFTYGYNTTRRRGFQSNHRSANGCPNFSPRQHVARSTAALTEILQLGFDLTQFSNDLVQALGP